MKKECEGCSKISNCSLHTPGVEYNKPCPCIVCLVKAICEDTCPSRLTVVEKPHKGLDAWMNDLYRG